MVNFQEDFVKTILNGTSSIYHNNFIATHIKALREIYPSIYALIGQVCFENIAKVFIPQHLSVSYKLQDYGEKFPEFLGMFEPLKSLPYLADVAHLEWEIHDIYFAKETWHPVVRFVSSEYPVLSIWEFCREAASEKKLDLSIGGENVMLQRKDREIIFIREGRSPL